MLSITKGSKKRISLLIRHLLYLLPSFTLPTCDPISFSTRHLVDHGNEISPTAFQMDRSTSLYPRLKAYVPDDSKRHAHLIRPKKNGCPSLQPVGLLNPHCCLQQIDALWVHAFGSHWKSLERQRKDCVRICFHLTTFLCPSYSLMNAA